MGAAIGKSIRAHCASQVLALSLSERFSVLLVDHLENFGLVTVGQQIMRGVDVGEALLVVCSSLVIDVFILVGDFDGVDGHAVDQFLGIGSIVFGELHVNEAGEGMSVSSNSNHSVLVSVAIDDLLLQSSLFISGASVSRLLSINSVVAENPFSLLGVELFNRIFLLLLDLRLVIFLEGSDLGIVLLFEL